MYIFSCNLTRSHIFNKLTSKEARIYTYSLLTWLHILLRMHYETESNSLLQTALETRATVQERTENSSVLARNLACMLNSLQDWTCGNYDCQHKNIKHKAYILSAIGKQKIPPK